jgi:hypothetical protein
VVKAESHRIQVVRELLGIGVGAEVALGDAGAEGDGDRVQPVPLQADQLVTRGARAIVQLAGRGHEHAAAGDGVGPAPAIQRSKMARDARLPRGSGQGRAHDVLDEALGREAQDLDLQGFLGPEVGEEPALGEAELLGQVPDADPSRPLRLASAVALSRMAWRVISPLPIPE